jgi:hypothetical protein
MQIRGGDGTGYLQGCLEMRVAYDPGWYLSDLIEFYVVAPYACSISVMLTCEFNKSPLLKRFLLPISAQI